MLWGNMLKNKKTKILAIISIIFVVFALMAYFVYVIDTDQTSTTSTTVDDTYYISKYDYNMVVNEDNTATVSEKITARFKVSYKHGIYRNIPLVVKTNVEENGEQKEYIQRIKITDIKGNQNAVELRENENLIIRFGKEDKYQPVHTDVVFELQYVINMGKDYAETYDMFYYSLVGADWETQIHDFHFSIELPKQFDASQLNFYTGKFNENKAFTGYSVNNNKITGSVDLLQPGQVLTAGLMLPNNYFSTAETITFDSGKTIMMVAICIAIFTILLFMLRNKKEPLVMPVEFYAPDGMNPVDVGHIYNGKVDTQDISSLIVYFASKKYLKLSVNEHNEVVLTKLKEISPKAKSYEKTLFNRLFANGDTINLDTDFDDNADFKYIDKDGEEQLFDTSSLPMTIYNCATKARAIKPVENRYDTKNLTFAIIGLIPAIIVAFAYYFSYISVALIADAIMFFVTLPIFAILFVYFIHIGLCKHKYSKAILLYETILAGLFVALYFFIIDKSYIVINYTLGYTHYVTLACALIAVMFSTLTISYSKEQTQKLGRVLGFKNFLETCEQDRINLLVKDNPEYFFDVLPYTFVFGISDAFIDRFKYLCVDYNYNTNSFDVTDYIIVRSVIGTKVSSMSSKAISVHRASTRSSGSGGGGGGFSGGGGFGGGGGGSW